MIVPGSRYMSAISTEVQTAQGLTRWALYPTPFRMNRTVIFRYQTAKQGDRFELLAAQEYGDPLLWWVLAQANPEVFYPDEIPPGAVIRIPNAASLR